MRKLLPSPRKRRLLRWASNLLLTALAFYLVLGRLSDLPNLWGTLRSLPVWAPVGAFLLYAGSKFIGSLRFRALLVTAGIRLDIRPNWRLYLLGLYYNLFLPGGVSGDGYKVVVLQQRFHVGYRRLLRIALLDRLNGLLILLLMAALAGGAVPMQALTAEVLARTGTQPPTWLGKLLDAWLLWALPLWGLGYAAYAWGLARWAADERATAHRIGLHSLAVQGLQVISVGLLVLAWGEEAAMGTYVLLFLLSSIATVLPLTVAGLGLRELVFAAGAAVTAARMETAISLGLVISVLHLLLALSGAVFSFRGTRLSEAQVG